MAKPLNTLARRKALESRDKANKLLESKGWKHDGLWWISPYTQIRYDRREALSVEEIREWGSGESAILNDKNHSMWVKKEAEDNKLISFEELSTKSQEAQKLKKLAIDGCYK